MVQLAYDKIFVSFCREIARMLADEHMKRVVIVDTSNEIGGDGDVPHEGIGRARRMQVPNVNMQHNVSVFFLIAKCQRTYSRGCSLLNCLGFDYLAGYD